MLRACSPALGDSLAQGQPLLDYAAQPTLADGLAGGIGLMVYTHRHLVDEVVEVTEPEIEDETNESSAKRAPEVDKNP